MARKITATTCHEQNVAVVEASEVKCGAGDHETGHSNDEELTPGQAEILIQPKTLMAAMSGGASGAAVAVTSMVPVNGTNNGGRDMI